MSKRTVVGALSAGLLLAAGVVVAQPMDRTMGGGMGGPMGGPMGRWWDRPQVAEQLALTPDQKQKLETVTLNGARTMIDLKGAVEKAEIDLRAASDAEPFQPDKVREAFHVMQQARERLEMQRFEMLLKVRSVLSAEQWQKLRTVVRERGAMRGRAGGEDRGPRRRPN
jgi:Spy/CpxP family protein refolding chaperone